MTRFEQRKQDFFKVLERLKDGIKQEESEIMIDGILHRFEFTFELAWKTIKDYLEYLGYIDKIGSPREIIQNGYKQGIIKDGEKWIDMMLARNTLAHIYDESTSREIYNKIKEEFILLFDNLKLQFENINI
ncbi:MAG: nucleotidyltransferase substrate binding protein [Clostridia bacterium]|nr:nucleotidyltransferase substrate binding protein [Clostridia bacterium]